MLSIQGLKLKFTRKRLPGFFYFLFSHVSPSVYAVLWTIDSEIWHAWFTSPCQAVDDFFFFPRRNVWISSNPTILNHTQNKIWRELKKGTTRSLRLFCWHGFVEHVANFRVYLKKNGEDIGCLITSIGMPLSSIGRVLYDRDVTFGF